MKTNLDAVSAFHQEKCTKLRSETQISGAPQPEKGLTGAGHLTGPTVLAHADRQIGAAKLQEGVQTATVLVHAM